MTRYLFLSLIFLLFWSATFAQLPVVDLLLYQDSETSSITAYNPVTGEKLELPVIADIQTIKPRGDGRIAYIQDNDVWLLDVLNAPDNPTNITQTLDEQEARLRWTPAGNLQYQVGSDPGPYVLYTYDGREVIVEDYGYDLEQHWNEQGWYVAAGAGWYVWNGSERIDLILPSEGAWQTFQWTPGNHLFITVAYYDQEYGQPIGSTDVFYWNGVDVRKIDHPSDDETFMIGDWSADGRLLIYTSHDWYIWDGVSFTVDGVPDTSTLVAINGPTEHIDDVEWMPDGRLAIVAEGDPSSDTLLGHAFTCPDPCAPQVYLWDAQTIHQITSNESGGLLIDAHDSGSIAVSNFDGLRIERVTVFDSSLQSVFQSSGLHSISRWSADGNLAYCKGDDLLVWDGKASTSLGSGTDSVWLLALSSSMTCSTG